jgi:hypothetical protein
MTRDRIFDGVRVTRHHQIPVISDMHLRRTPNTARRTSKVLH